MKGTEVATFFFLIFNLYILETSLSFDIILLMINSPNK